MIVTLRQRWHAMSRRERIVLGAGGVLMAGSLLFVLVIDPWLEHLDRMDRQIHRAQQHLHELQALGGRYAAVRTKLSGLEAKLAGPEGQFSLLPFLEETAGQANVRDRIAAMQPQESPPLEGYKETAVEVRLEGVVLQELLGFLVKLEESPRLLQVKRVQLKPRFDSPHLLEATVLVATHAKV